MSVEDWINVPSEDNLRWTARWNAWMQRLVRYLRGLDKTYTWTPQIAQGAGVATTVTLAEYVRVGDTVSGQCHVVGNGAGTATLQIFVSAPITQSPVHAQACGSGYYQAAGVTYPLNVYMGTSGLFAFEHTHVLSSFLGSGAFAGAVAVGHVLSFNFSYNV